jgi:hypothetical protein
MEEANWVTVSAGIVVKFPGRARNSLVSPASSAWRLLWRNPSPRISRRTQREALAASKAARAKVR